MLTGGDHESELVNASPAFHDNEALQIARSGGFVVVKSRLESQRLHHMHARRNERAEALGRQERRGRERVETLRGDRPLVGPQA